MKTKYRYREGDRVRMLSRIFGTYSPQALREAPGRGETGTVGTVAGFRGASIFCDPSHIMIFVNWDEARPQGVFVRELEPVTCAGFGRACDKRARGLYRFAAVGEPVMRNLCEPCAIKALRAGLLVKPDSSK